ncbi:MAG TPA: helix-turn-helix domain-containing protein [Acidothermaceae bacterium]|jgi:transcriptional regulator with XRE-family HTH domain|nr:helix-turn-helix domain-containing protein [Acidothermaceae bacterium]
MTNATVPGTGERTGTPNDGVADIVAMLGLEDVDASGGTAASGLSHAALDLEVGQRVRLARRRAGLDAKELAEAIGLSQDKISKIEHGRRRVSPRELPALAQVLRVSIQTLLGSVDLARPTLALAHRVAESGPATDTSRTRQRAIDVLEAGDWLERATNVVPLQLSPGGAAVSQLVANQFTEAPRTRPEAQRQGRQLAEEVRRALDLGVGEIGDLPALIEMHFVADVALSPLGDSSDGLCAHDGNRALLVANTDHTAGHVRFTLGHELGHHLLRDPRDVIEEQTADMFVSSYRERRVNAFAAHLLLPVKAVEATLAWLGCSADDIKAGNPRGRTALGYLMTRYGVSLQCTLNQVAAASIIDLPDAVALKEQLSASTLVRAARHLASGTRPGPTVVNRDQRPPARLVSAALEAAREGVVGLHTVAVLLGRDNDDALFNQVMFGEDADDDAVGVTSATPPANLTDRR